MVEPTPSPSPTPSPAPSPSPDPAPTPASAAAARPEYIPEQFWDTQSNAVKTEEFGKHYSEIAAFHSEHAPKIAALVTRKPDDIKFEVQLPRDVKVPEGLNFDPAKDPRTPQVRGWAHKYAVPQEAVNELVALDAQQKIAEHTAAVAEYTADMKKLGEKAEIRKTAVTNWAKGLKDKGEISADEFNELASTALSSAGVTLLEKIIAKAAGSVPGHAPESERPANSQPKTFGERVWGQNAFDPNPQARAS